MELGKAQVQVGDLVHPNEEYCAQVWVGFLIG